MMPIGKQYRGFDEKLDIETRISIETENLVDKLIKQIDLNSVDELLEILDPEFTFKSFYKFEFIFESEEITNLLYIGKASSDVIYSANLDRTMKLSVLRHRLKGTLVYNDVEIELEGDENDE